MDTVTDMLAPASEAVGDLFVTPVTVGNLVVVLLVFAAFWAVATDPEKTFAGFLLPFRLGVRAVRPAARRALAADRGLAQAADMFLRHAEWVDRYGAGPHIGGPDADGQQSGPQLDN